LVWSVLQPERLDRRWALLIESGTIARFGELVLAVQPRRDDIGGRENRAITHCSLQTTTGHAKPSESAIDYAVQLLRHRGIAWCVAARFLRR
jgi:hypothetical protein